VDAGRQALQAWQVRVGPHAQLAGEDLRFGRVVRLFDVSQPVAFGYYFVCPPAKAAQRKVALFRDWILRETKADAAYPKKN
jgi:DNA-binding transcriptional LysR family regulator